MDVLEGDVENVYGRPGDRITGSYFSRLRSIKSRTGRRCIKMNYGNALAFRLWEMLTWACSLPVTPFIL